MNRKRVSLTIDDFPYLVDTINLHTVDNVTETMSNLVLRASNSKAPCAYFLNSAWMNDCYLDVVKMAVGMGFDIGNHTENHYSLSDISIEHWECDVISCQKYMVRNGLPIPKFFRFPYLDYGNSRDIRNKTEKYIATLGYRNSHVSVINKEWLLSIQYDNARNIHERKKIEKDAIEHLIEALDVANNMALRSYRHQPAQIILLHSSMLVSEILVDFIDLARSGGWEWISLSDALDDPLYRLQDNYITRDGIPWLARTTTSNGRKYLSHWFENSLKEYSRCEHS